MIQFQHIRYDLPGGAVSRRYVDILSEEVSQVTAGNYSSDRLIVFSTCILQKDRMIRKGVDIRRVLKQCMMMWKCENYGLLHHEAIRCDKS